jgi:hypothetical protein
VDESEPEAGREEDQAAPLEDQAAPLEDQPAVKNEARPATRRSLRMTGSKADLVSLPYKGRPL